MGPKSRAGGGEVVGYAKRSIKLSKSSNDVVATVKIQTLRDKYDPNYKIILAVFSKKPLPWLGEFEAYAADRWNYAYLLEDKGVNIHEIQETHDLPKDADIFLRAVRKVDAKDIFHTYVATVKSSLSAGLLERVIVDWLNEEGYWKVLAWAYKLPKVKSEKRLKITRERFEKVLSRRAH